MEKDLDKKLYNDYLNGEKEAFEILYNKYKNKIEYFIYNIVKDYQKAEDIAQETFIYVIQHKMRENSSFKYYIYLVARSKALNYINVEKRRNEITEKYLASSLMFSICAGFITYIGLLLGKYSVKFLKDKAYILGITLLGIMTIVNICQIIFN